MGEFNGVYLISGDDGTIRKFNSDIGYSSKVFKQVMTVAHVVGGSGVKDPCEIFIQRKRI